MKTIYTIVFMLIAGCFYSQQADSTRQDSCSIFIPNSITANGDGLHLFQVIPTCPVSGFTITVYNRWGQRVYYQDSLTANYMINWKFENKNVSSGTYFWVIQYSFQYDMKKERTIKGYVTLLK